MKKQYRELMMSYLKELPEDTEITCKPGSWYGKNFSVGTKTLIGDRIYQLINKEQIELALLERHVNDVARNGTSYRQFTSYKVKFNKETSNLEGKIKRPVEKVDRLIVKFSIPEEIWFDTMNFSIDVSSKKTVKVKCDISVRNGMHPKNVDEIMKDFCGRVERSVMRDIKGIKGRVSGGYRRFNLSYNKEYNIDLDYKVITHSVEDFNVSI